VLSGFDFLKGGREMGLTAVVAADTSRAAVREEVEEGRIECPHCEMTFENSEHGRRIRRDHILRVHTQASEILPLGCVVVG
jgi:hypothetical protein